MTVTPKQSLSEYQWEAAKATGSSNDASGDSTVVGQLKAIAAGVASDAVPSSTLSTSQVTVAATATSILAANTDRVGAVIVNNSAVSIFLGQTSAVTISNGIELPAKASFSIDSPLYTGAVFGIVATSTAGVTVGEFS